MKPVTSIDEAMALPGREVFDYTEELLPNGIKKYTPYFRDLVAVDKDDDAIILFRDKDRRTMTVNYDSGGAYKTPVYKRGK